jgi:hypothetical protein
VSLDRMVKVRLSAGELRAWQRAAGGNLSGWLRELANERAGRAGGGGRRRAAAPPASREPASLEPEISVGVTSSPLYRRGRCRQHPNALPRSSDLTRCTWGCKLP